MILLKFAIVYCTPLAKKNLLYFNPIYGRYIIFMSLMEVHSSYRYSLFHRFIKFRVSVTLFVVTKPFWDQFFTCKNIAINEFLSEFLFTQVVPIEFTMSCHVQTS